MQCFSPKESEHEKSIPVIISVGSGCCQAKPVKLNHLYKGGKLADVPPVKQDYVYFVPWEENTKETITSKSVR